MTKFRCKNCPSRPVFTSLEQLENHWKLTHTVPMEHTARELGPVHPLVEALLGDKLNQTIKLYEEITDG